MTNSLLQISASGDAIPASETPTTAMTAKAAIRAALLTGGGDKPYALGLASALLAQGISFDFIGSDEVDGPELHNNARVTFLNLRGEQTRNAGAFRKLQRILVYYIRLLRYAATARPRIFHLLWNN